MVSKRDRYYSGKVSGYVKPLPNEGTGSGVYHTHKERLRLACGAVVLLGVGMVVGMTITKDPSKQQEAALVTMESDLRQAHAQIAELERSLAYGKNGQETAEAKGRLSPAIRKNMLTTGHKYAKLLRDQKAQSAAELFDWFVERWVDLLDFPEANDRIGRRAETLSRLVGGMAAHLHPKDYVPWQAEFFSGHWLGDLHFDLDEDGFPTSRIADNPKDGFAKVSVCQIAMSLNLLATDARILVMPDMSCDQSDARMSVFLQGHSIDDAFSEFVKAVRREGYIAVEKQEKGTRLILLGARPKVREE